MASSSGTKKVKGPEKGLLQDVTELLPYVEHRQCVRHIYGNFRKKYTGLEVKNLFWEAAKSTVEGNFIATMKKIKDITPSGYEWLMSNKQYSWSRAFFSHGYACEAIENGILECFKAVEGTSKEASEGNMKAVEGTSKEAGKMIDIDQPISPLKRMKMMARRGGKIKYVRRIRVVHGSISQNVASVDEAVLTCHEKLDHEDFETIKDLQASGYDHGEIDEAFNKLKKERKERLVESIVDEETSQEIQDPLVRKRKPSERIIKIKLNKAVHDPDGGGSTTEKALTLD
ncbi:unnamed protein product [Lactuca saligna]|uniref:MULE transposase domain-containing protein n=1 Tax=Lactuca saligna TaxID=75948 RepID=A0AA35YPE9_LACSI|nr:unnamed protein product [Lactuca saligna]